jgi:ferritin-like metal-binding protein YciE
MTGIHMAKVRTLKDGLIEQLREIYSAENQILANLTRVEQKTTNRRLKEAFHAHLLATEGQLERLDEMGVLLGTRLSGATCDALRGLMAESKEITEDEYENKALLDAVLSSVAQKAEHYSIGAYESAHAMVRELGLDSIAKLIEETLTEERYANKLFSAISFGEVLPRANIPASGDDREQRVSGTPAPKTQPRHASISTSRNL